MILVQHHLSKHLQVRINIIHERIQLLMHDIIEQGIHTCTIKGFLKSDELVKDDTNRPYISLEVILHAFAHFRGHVVRGACDRTCEQGSLELFSNTKVSQLQNVVLGYEDVLTFYVSVHDVFRMHGHHTQSDLRNVR